jgi:hypothetical protein
VVTVVVGVGCDVTVVPVVPVGRCLRPVHRCRRLCRRKCSVTVITWGSMDRTVGGASAVVTVVRGKVPGVSEVVVGAGSGRTASVDVCGSLPADFTRCWPPKPTRRVATTAATNPNVASGTRIRLRMDSGRACFGCLWCLFFAAAEPRPEDFACAGPYETSGFFSSKLIPVVILRRRFGNPGHTGVQPL